MFLIPSVKSNEASKPNRRVTGVLKVDLRKGARIKGARKKGDRKKAPRIEMENIVGNFIMMTNKDRKFAVI